jgi:hypothetical protein
MQVISRRALPLLAALAAPSAFAGPVENTLGEARIAIEDAEFEQARALLERARESAVVSEEIVPGDSLARIEYYQGIVEFYDGDTQDEAMSHWRKALIHSSSFGWDASLIADQDARDIFEALRNEIRQRNQLPSGVPEQEIEGFRVFIDGNRTYDYDMVIQGRHLVQVLCPDESVSGTWTDFGDAPDYVGYCPGLELPEATSTTTREPRERGDGPNWLAVGLMGGGGALVLGGTAMYFVSVVPAYDGVESANNTPINYTREEADELSTTFNRARAIDLVLLGAGAATAGVGIGIAIDADLRLAPMGRGAVLQGRF